MRQAVNYTANERGKGVKNKRLRQSEGRHRRNRKQWEEDEARSRSKDARAATLHNWNARLTPLPGGV